MGNDLNWIVAGLVASVLVPAAAFAGLPLIFAFGLGALAFVALVVFLAPKKLYDDRRFARVDRKTKAEARALLEETTAVLKRLASASDRIEDAVVRHKVNALTRIADDIYTLLEADPTRLGDVRRFLSVYLPQAANVAEGYALVEHKKIVDPKRLDEISAVIDKLQDGFAHYADGLAEAELGALDTDLKSIESSLQKDIER